MPETCWAIDLSLSRAIVCVFCRSLLCSELSRYFQCSRSVRLRMWDEKKDDLKDHHNDIGKLPDLVYQSGERTASGTKCSSIIWSSVTTEWPRRQPLDMHDSFDISPVEDVKP